MLMLRLTCKHLFSRLYFTILRLSMSIFACFWVQSFLLFKIHFLLNFKHLTIFYFISAYRIVLKLQYAFCCKYIKSTKLNIRLLR